ncbi:SLOG family protein [Bacteroides caecimuris]|uniref:SLOG family protein n=1 Tax=Bacteroides caecimuris TaxID=1796613 RepID=UPI0026E57C6A|nr:SLOG family protein [Bacteroides caecimuris]
MKMKLAIVGILNPRVSYAEWEELLLSEVNTFDVAMVVSGGAKGVDSIAKRFAARHHIPLMEFLPNYVKFGRYATLRRNTQIVKEANCVIAFPSSNSRGTLHNINEAKRLGKHMTIINI